MKPNQKKKSNIGKDQNTKVVTDILEFISNVNSSSLSIKNEKSMSDNNGGRIYY